MFGKEFKKDSRYRLGIKRSLQREVGRVSVRTRPLIPTCRRGPVWSAARSPRARSTDDWWHTSSSTHWGRQRARESVRASARERDGERKKVQNVQWQDKKRKHHTRLWFSHSHSLRWLLNTQAMDFTTIPKFAVPSVTTFPQLLFWKLFYLNFLASGCFLLHCK